MLIIADKIFPLPCNQNRHPGSRHSACDSVCVPVPHSGHQPDQKIRLHGTDFPHDLTQFACQTHLQNPLIVLQRITAPDNIFQTFSRLGKINLFADSLKELFHATVAVTSVLRTAIGESRIAARVKFLIQHHSAGSVKFLVTPGNDFQRRLDQPVPVNGIQRARCLLDSISHTAALFIRSTIHELLCFLMIPHQRNRNQSVSLCHGNFITEKTQARHIVFRHQSPVLSGIIRLDSAVNAAPSHHHIEAGLT